MKWLPAVAIGLAAVPAHATTVAGPATVIDGDTLEIDGHRIRLVGIDAPELSQNCDRAGENWACGAASAEQLHSMIGDYPLSCSGDEVDTYGRLLAVCTISRVDLNRTMVAQGWATAFRRYSEAYVPDEMRARAARLGLWSSSFTRPEDFRQQEDRQALATTIRQPDASASRTSNGCAIKGNRNSRGEWIYHLPGMQYYERTRAEEMFCTEAEAQAAGYRRSRSG